MVLLNRRGYSPVVLCRACGKTLQCKNCAVSMTHHKREHKMECHYCGHVEASPTSARTAAASMCISSERDRKSWKSCCTACFRRRGLGGLDRDTVRGHEDFEHALNALNEGALDMLVGTQMIAKGHDIHGVTLVGVVAATWRWACRIFARPKERFNC
jgi:primosomal protein N' (replication factor Y)